MTRRYVTTLVSLLAACLTMQATTIPFRVVKKTIIIEAMVNKRKGYFVLDTGTPYLVLNSQVFNGVPTGTTVTGLLGEPIDVYKKEVKLTIGDIHWNRLEATLLPLDHLSRIKGIPIMGLIGTDALKKYELTIDFDISELQLWKIRKKTAGEDSHRLPNASLSFLWRGGIPVIQTMVGDQSLLFGFDTGATINVLSRQKRELLRNHLTSNAQVEVYGMTADRQSLESGILHQVIVGDYYCPEMRIVLSSWSRFKGFDNQLNAIDGFIGFELLQHFKTVINFRHGTIKLYQREQSGEPYFVAR